MCTVCATDKIMLRVDVFKAATALARPGSTTEDVLGVADFLMADVTYEDEQVPSEAQ